MSVTLTVFLKYSTDLTAKTIEIYGKEQLDKNSINILPYNSSIKFVD
ncbi:MAG: hypothetical protein ACPK85_00350 [Methanosarcina sp.]